MSWATAVDGMDVSFTLVLGDLSADLGFMEGGQGLIGLRPGLGCLLWEWEGPCGVVLLIGSLNWTVFMVILEMLDGEFQGGVVHCGKVIRGS